MTDDTATVEAQTTETTETVDTTSTETTQTATETTETVVQDWHAEWTGGDDSLAKLAGRYAGPKEMAQALANTQRSLREGGRVKIPGKNASEDDLTAWNTALGRPETVEGYGDALTPEMPEGMEFDDANRAMLTALAEDAHAAGGVVSSPEAIKFMANAYGKVLQVQQQQMKEAADAVAAKHAQDLRTTWGQGFNFNLKMANAGIERFMGEGFEEVRGFTLMNEKGEPQGRLGDHPVIANAMMEAMRASSEDPTFLLTNTGDSMGADAMQAEIEKIRGYRLTDPDKYQANYQRLLELRGKLDRVSAAA